VIVLSGKDHRSSSAPTKVRDVASIRETRFSEKHAATPRAIAHGACWGSVSSAILTEAHEKAGENGVLSIAMALCSHGMRLEELEQECDDKVGRNTANDHRRDHRQNLRDNAHFGRLEHLTKRLNRLWIHMTARIRFNVPTGTKGPVMNGEALFR
jgi:hypothetical protein